MEWKNEYKSQVEFNEAIGIVFRLDNLQKEINKSYSNMMAIEDNGRFGYENLINALDCMYHELSADLTEKEDAKINLLRKKIRLTLKLAPPLKKANTNSFKSDNLLQLHTVNYENFKELLDEYRRTINKCKKDHGYGNPEKESAANAMLR